MQKEKEMTQPAIGNFKRTKEIMQKYGLHAKKGFGQNFLTNPTVLSGIKVAALCGEWRNMV